MPKETAWRKEIGWIRDSPAWSTTRKAVALAVAVVGFVLTWTGWTGPELLDEIAEVPWLSFASAGWFRTVLVVVGLGTVGLLAHRWYRVADYTIDEFQVSLGSEDRASTFNLSVSFDRDVSHLGIQMMRDPRIFKVITSVWVTVENNGDDAVFRARVRGIEPVARAEDGLRLGPRNVDQVAWEHTTDPEHLIRGGHHARLKLAAGSESFELFWFWTAESATWTDQGDRGWRHYGIGWRFKPLAERVEFDLEVSNVTHSRSESRRCFLDFGARNRIERFGFLDSVSSGA